MKSYRISQRPFVLLGLFMAAAAASACRTGSGGTDLAGAEGGAAEPGGTLTIGVIPPHGSLDWSTPNSLIYSSAKSKIRGELDKKKGLVKIPHPVGHLHVTMDCANGVSIPTTGQTGGGSEYASALDGVGASFRIFPGYLDDTAAVTPDIATREASGKIASMVFKISGATCRHLAGFLNEYKTRGADKFYGGQFRPRRFEGSGCSAFGVSFIEVGGLMRRSLYTPVWARSVDVGVGRISDVLGDGYYRYGSNLISYDEAGAMKPWPKGKDMRVQTATIVPGSPWLKNWNAPNDAQTNQAPNEQPNVVPWTIYDPELIYNFIDSVWTAGGGEALGRKWTATTRGQSRVIETDATDATVLPWEDSVDDLRKD